MDAPFLHRSHRHCCFSTPFAGIFVGVFACLVVLYPATPLPAAQPAAAYTAPQYETQNFTVRNAPTPKLAREFCETAERCRLEMALLWLGKALPDWSEKCPISVMVGENLGAGGATSFIFHDGEVYGWEMAIQGSADRIVDSVLPHEITHMVWATHFRRPVQRWIDEGAATSVEHVSEKENYRNLLRHYLRNDVRKCLPFRQMVMLKEYPADPMPFYAQGFSVIAYLLALGDDLGKDGHRRLVRFAEAGQQTGDWDAALQQHYEIDSLGQLQRDRWIVWIEAGSPTTDLDLVALRSQVATTELTSESLSAELSTESPEPRTLSSGPNSPHPIALVSARPSPPYGRSVYENLAKHPVTSPTATIPNRAEADSNVVPIPVLVDFREQAIVR